MLKIRITKNIRRKRKLRIKYNRAPSFKDRNRGTLREGNEEGLGRGKGKKGRRKGGGGRGREDKI